MSRRRSFVFNMSDFFYGDIRREFVEDRLKNDGDFIFRRTSVGNGLVISVLWKDKVRHFSAVQTRTKKYSFGDKEFNSIPELVEYHWRNRIPLPDSARTLLLNPIKCPKTLYKYTDIEILEKLGDGNFGEVYKVKIKSEDLECAMKTLKDSVNEEERESFQKELDMMKLMYHENIVQWIGTVVPPPGTSEMKILLEFVNYGSLERLLRKGKITERGKVKICMQVAQGLAYLHHHHIIHRDMAARNILIHADERGAITAKVSDFGLSRIDESGQGYELRRAQKLPLKWLAPECFEEKRWTMASDVWSLGVVMWECFTDGEIPYSDKNFKAAELSKYVQTGGHPSRPKQCNDTIYEIMLQCWNRSPDQRPAAIQLEKTLEELYNKAKERSRR